MGHAEHFLQRLDRVSDRQVELALTLYRDHQLLRSVLDGAQLPDGVERVALSLDHDIEGPFVVLTRDGRFVTCLAVGMRVSDLPIITRTRLDVLSAREQRVRDELARIRQVTEGGSDGQVHRYSPLVAALRFDRLSHEQHELTQALEQAIWACSHLDTIFAAQLASSVLSFDEAQYRATVAAAVLDFDWCVSAQGLRSLWAASRSGKDGLHYLRHTVSTRAHLTTGLFSELALGAFAHASSKLRAEAIKAMTKPSSPLLGPFPADESPRAAVARTIMLGFEQDPASFDALLLVLGRGVVARACPEFDAPDIDLVQAVPDAVAYAALTNQARSWQADRRDGCATRVRDAGWRSNPAPTPRRSTTKSSRRPRTAEWSSLVARVGPVAAASSSLTCGFGRRRQPRPEAAESEAARRVARLVCASPRPRLASLMTAPSRAGSACAPMATGSNLPCDRAGPDQYDGVAAIRGAPAPQAPLARCVGARLASFRRDLMETRQWQVVFHLHGDNSATVRIQSNGRLLMPSCDGLPIDEALGYLSTGRRAGAAASPSGKRATLLASACARWSSPLGFSNMKREVRERSLTGA